MVNFAEPEEGRRLIHNSVLVFGYQLQGRASPRMGTWEFGEIEGEYQDDRFFGQRVNADSHG